MRKYWLRSLTARLRSGRALYALTLVGVALGVASVLSIQILNRNALGAFAGSMKAVTGDADLSVLGSGPSLPDSLLPRTLAVPGVGAAWPLSRVDVALVGRSGFLEILGVDLLFPTKVPWRKPVADVSAALSDSGWVALSPRLARELALAPGDTFRVSSGSTTRLLTLGALIDFQRASPLASRRLAIMDIAQVQSLFAAGRGLTEIDVSLAPGADRAQVASRLAEALGPAVQIRTPESRERQAAGLLEAFRLNLTALSLVSLFVGVFLVYASMTAMLVRRRSEMGLLRSLGAGRGQVTTLILSEVAALALIGVAIGLPLGYWVASANVRTVSATLSNLYLLEEIDTLRLPFLLYVLAAAVGLGGALGGALLPTLDLTRRDTRALLSPFQLHERIGRSAAPLALTALGVLAAAAIWYGVFGRSLRPAGFALGLAVLVAQPLAVPWILRHATRWVPEGRLGWAYGIRSVGARLHTTSFAVASLAVAVSMLFGITLLIGSFRRTVELWVESTARADVYISTESWLRGRSEATLDSSVVTLLASEPGVRAVDRLRQLFVTVRGRRIALSGIDASLPEANSRVHLLAGDPGRAAENLRRGAVLVGEPLARKADLRVGDRLEVYGPQGPVSLPIAGIYYDYTTEAGTALMDLRVMAERFGRGPVQNAALYLSPGVDPETVVASLHARLAGVPLRIRSQRALRAEILRVFDQTFAVTRLLQGMSLLIAAAGIALALFVLARERAAEIALYRALGAARGQVFRVFVGKGLGMGLIGLVVGALGGIALAVILIYLVNRTYFGWTIAFRWPGPALARQAATILATAIVASLYPAWIASRATAAALSRDDL